MYIIDKTIVISYLFQSHFYTSHFIIKQAYGKKKSINHYLTAAAIFFSKVKIMKTHIPIPTHAYVCYIKKITQKLNYYILDIQYV